MPVVASPSSSSSSSPLPKTLLLLTLAVLPTAAHAQDRLFLGNAELGAIGRFGDRLGDAPPAVYGELAAGGRFVVEPTRAFDTRTGEAIAISGGSVVGVDPRRPRVFVHDGTTLSIFDLESRAVTPLLAVAPHDPDAVRVAMARVAHDSNELFVLRRLPSGFYPGDTFTPAEFAVIDLATGVTTRTLSVMPPGVIPRVLEWRPTSDGRRIVLNSLNYVALADGVTGAILAQQDLGFAAGGLGRLFDDRGNRRYYLHEWGRLTVFDDNLQGLVQLPLYNGGCVPSVFGFSPHTGRAYVTEGRGGIGGPPGYPAPAPPLQLTLSVYDTNTGRRLASRDVAGMAGPLPGAHECDRRPLAVLTAPGPPADVTSVVTGRDVTLAWTNVGDATGFVLDVGLSPGRTDLTFSVGAVSPVTIASAPPGTYYLRVRGTNAFGVSRPSTEVAITVP
jgi:hypothetical protein